MSRAFVLVSTLTAIGVAGCASAPRLEVVANGRSPGLADNLTARALVDDLDIQGCFETQATWLKSNEPQHIVLALKAEDGKVFVERATPRPTTVVGNRLAGCLRGVIDGWKTYRTGRVELDIVARTPAKIERPAPGATSLAAFVPAE